MSRTDVDEIMETATGGDLPADAVEEDQGPLFKVVGESRIPVSRHFGASWKKRKDATAVVLEEVHASWNEAYSYFNNHQVKDVIQRDERVRTGFKREESTENVVFANTMVMMAATYAKNPDIVFETDQDEDKQFAVSLQKAVNGVLTKRNAPGINLKPRVKKAVLHSELTNFGVLKLGFNFKDESREEAMQEADRLLTELRETKSEDDIKRIEGELLALEQTMEYREPSGFTLQTLVPFRLFVDPFAENSDLSDSNWVIEETYIPTDLLNALYTEVNDDGERVYIYKPTHRAKTTGGRDSDIFSGTALESLADEESEGHTDEQRLQYIYENMTKCNYVWDRATRRIYLFQDDDWTWPIWVWEDRLGLSRFFPYFVIQFAPSTGGVPSVGEASYYLDQQDEINDINKELARIRRCVFNLFFYNKNRMKPEDASKMIQYMRSGKGEPVYGIDIPEGMSLQDCIESPAPPSIRYSELFNKEPLYAAIDRIASTSDALRGTQFKANTTEDAVEAYMTSVRLRVGVKTDALEDVVADIAWSVAEILVQHVEPDLLSAFLSDGEIDKSWKAMRIEDLNRTMKMDVIAGSVEKPTSVFKKKEAVNLAQAIGQFSRGAPSSSLRLILKLLSTAFPEMNLTEEDWASIDQEMQALMQKGISEKQPQQSGEGNASREQQQPRSAAGNRPQQRSAGTGY